jgi:hypothetical protein
LAKVTVKHTPLPTLSTLIAEHLGSLQTRQTFARCRLPNNKEQHMSPQLAGLQPKLSCQFPSNLLCIMITIEAQKLLYFTQNLVSVSNMQTDFICTTSAYDKNKYGDITK